MLEIQLSLDQLNDAIKSDHAQSYEAVKELVRTVIGNSILMSDFVTSRRKDHVKGIKKTIEHLWTLNNVINGKLLLNT